MSKTASLTAGLVATKGQAAPSIPATVEPATAGKAASLTATYYKSLTVKLDKQRYQALKTAGLKHDKKSQEMFVEALDAYLASLDCR